MISSADWGSRLPWYRPPDIWQLRLAFSRLVLHKHTKRILTNFYSRIEQGVHTFRVSSDNLASCRASCFNPHSQKNWILIARCNYELINITRARASTLRYLATRRTEFDSPRPHVPPVNPILFSLPSLGSKLFRFYPDPAIPSPGFTAV